VCSSDLDTIAAMISGTKLHPGEIAVSYAATLGGTPEASIVGTRLQTSTVTAALANGMLAHADETDDSHAPSLTHPGCCVVPAALAIAEKTGASGEQFLRTVALGYDVCTRVNMSLVTDDLGATPHSTHAIGGTFGAGAGAGALFGFDARQVRDLLSYCAQQASGLSCNVRDTEHIEKAFDFAGMPARNGVTAATMVAHGFTGVDDVFSGERNFYLAFTKNPDPTQLYDGLGERFEIMATNIKKWSVGSPAQAALDALTHLMTNDGLKGENVASMRVHLATRSARTVDSAPMPDINVQHLMALLMVDGTLTFASTHDRARMADPAVLAVRKLIELVPSDELAVARPRRQAIVEASLRDGRKLSHRTKMVRGTADNPMTREEVEAKAHDLVAGVFGAARASALVEAVRGIGRVRDMREMQKLWSP